MTSQRLFNQVLSIAFSLFFVEVATPNSNSSLFFFFFFDNKMIKNDHAGANRRMEPEHDWQYRFLNKE
jgi:hypothetical protein